MGGNQSKTNQIAADDEEIESIESELTMYEILVREFTVDKILIPDQSYKAFLEYAEKKDFSQLIKIWKFAHNYKMISKVMGSKPKYVFDELNKHIVTNLSSNTVQGRVRESVASKVILTIQDGLSQLEEADGAAGVTVPSFEFLDELKEEIGDSIQGKEIEEFKKSDMLPVFINRFTTLQHVVDDNHSMLSFEQFLADEYTSENLDFWDSVNKFQKKFDPNNSRNNKMLARGILNMFILEDSPLQINIASKQREKVEKTVYSPEKVPIDVFNGAQKEVYLLMGRDAWTRFKSSEYWTKLLESRPPVCPDGSPLPLESSYRLRVKKFMEYVGDDPMAIILSNDHGRFHLDKYLRMSKPTDSSIQFLFAVQQFKLEKYKPNSALIIEAARSIYEELCNCPSVNELPIAKNFLTTIENSINFGDVGRDIFDDASDEVWDIFEEHEILEKFKATGLYTKYRLLKISESKKSKRTFLKK